MNFSTFLTAIVAVSIIINPIDAFKSYTNHAIVSSRHQLHRLALYVKPVNKKERTSSSSASKGFGKQTASPKLDLVHKSYGQIVTPQTHEDAQEAMHHFFSTHNEWHPLFSHVMESSSTLPAAHVHLKLPSSQQQQPNTDDIWNTNNLHQYPWSILPDKPSTNSSLATLSFFLDEWQHSLVNIPMDAFKDVKGGYDRHFLEEGRRTIAVTRFHVMDNDCRGEQEWELELFQLCWSELGHLMSKDEEDTGSLIVLPQSLNGQENVRSLECVQQFVAEKLIRPMEWLGRGQDWEIVAMERGAVAVRLLYKLGEIPDLSEKYQMEE
jgi:hypothetical protein